MKTLQYKGYQGVIEYEDGALFVRILHIDDVLIAQFDSAQEANSVFAELVEGYLADCLEIGKAPTKPFKGSFNVRLSPELHRRAAMMSAECGLSLNAWVTEAISEKLDCDQLTDRVENAFSLRLADAKVMQYAKSALHIQPKAERTQPNANEIERAAYYRHLSNNKVLYNV